MNNWPLYAVEGSPQISVQDARAIALEAFKNFSYQVTSDNGTVTTVSSFKIAPESFGHEKLVYLNYDNQKDARGGDTFTLYPAWFIQIGFDDFYPGDVTGVEVLVWADTGQVSGMHEMTADSSFAAAAVSNKSAITQQPIVNSDQNSSLPVAMFVGAFTLGSISFFTVKKGKVASNHKLFSLLGCSAFYASNGSFIR